MSSYDVEKFDPPPDPELVCCICTFVLDQPMESPCQHVFCRHCIETWLSRRRNCPTCRKKMSKRHMKPVLPLVQNMLNRLPMICDFHENGCREKPVLELYRTHIGKCEYEMMTCKFKNCQAQILRRDLLKHEQELCEFREVLCLRQCGLHIPIKDIDMHDCMLALKRHAEERQKHAEELEARLQSLMSLQRSLQEDVDKLRRQVEEERRRREEQDIWSPSFESTSSLFSSDEDNGDDGNTTAEILESDSDSDTDNTLQSTGHQASRDRTLSDSDVEFSRGTRRPTRPLSVSSNITDDVEIVDFPDAENVLAPDGNANSSTREAIDVFDEREQRTEEVEPNVSNNQNSGPDTLNEIVNQVTSISGIVRGFAESNTPQTTTDSFQETEQLVQQIKDCVNRLDNLNLPNPTWQAVCKYLTNMLSSLLRTKQLCRDVSITTRSSMPLQSDPTDSTTDSTGTVILDSAGPQLNTSVIAESDIFHSAPPTSVISGQIGELFDKWSVSDSAYNNSFHPQPDTVSLQMQRIIECCRSGFEANSIKLMPNSTTKNSDSGCLVSYQGNHSIREQVPIPTFSFEDQPMTRDQPQNSIQTEDSIVYRSDDLDKLLESATCNRVTGGPTVASVTSDDSCICLSSTDYSEETVEKTSDVYADISTDNGDHITRPTFPQISRRSLNPFLKAFDQAEKQETGKRQQDLKRGHLEVSSSRLFEPQKKKRNDVSSNKIPDFSDDTSGQSLPNMQPNLLKGLLSCLNNFSRVPKFDKQISAQMTSRSRPVSCTVTASDVRSDVVLSPGIENSRPNTEKNGEVPDTVAHESEYQVMLPSLSVRQGRRIHFPEPPCQPREIADVPVPPRTAQLLVEYSEDSDSSWEPGNSDMDRESDDINTSEDEDSDSNY